MTIWQDKKHLSQPVEVRVQGERHQPFHLGFVVFPLPFRQAGPGVEVRRLFHKLRSTAIENFNEQFKGIFRAHEQVPTKGKVATRRFALGAVLLYQMALLYRHEQNMDLRVGLKPFLRAA